MATHISDEELTAYLDGEADAALTARIEDGGPELAARLDGLRFDESQLRAQAGAILADASSFELPSTTPARGFGVMGAAMAACLAIGLGLGFVMSGKPHETSGWMQYVAVYQALYVEDTLSQADGDTSRIPELSAVLGRDLSPAVAPPELTFKRGQQLGFNGKPLIQLAYLSEGGTPMALCIFKTTGDASSISQSVLEGMQAASWSDGRFAYLLIGGEDADLVQRSAAHFQTQL